ncbi:hypothetical protein J6590_060234 [Homalodisca vitripennis]|nr:hypothetical protein J6590_060234 [Homalodisca vitripennis]
MLRIPGTSTARRAEVCSECSLSYRQPRLSCKCVRSVLSLTDNPVSAASVFGAFSLLPTTPSKLQVCSERSLSYRQPRLSRKCVRSVLSLTDNPVSAASVFGAFSLLPTTPSQPQSTAGDDLELVGFVPQVSKGLASLNIKACHPLPAFTGKLVQSCPPSFERT